MARRAADFASDAAVVVVNPDDDVTPERFTEWLNRRQTGEPLSLSVSAADTLAEVRSTGTE